MSSLLQDIRLALRDLKSGLLVTSLAVLSLAIAIAGNTTVFSLINGLLFRPLPYPQADRIALLGEREDDAAPTLVASAANLVDWRERNRTFADLAGFRPAPMSLGDGERPEPIITAEVSPGFFEMLGAVPDRGRLLGIDDARRGASGTVVLSHEFWRERFAVEDDPIGETLVLNREPYTIAGVLAEGFEFFNPQVRLWVPLSLDREVISRDRRDVLVVGRLGENVTMEQARADLTNVHRELALEYPETNRGFVVDVLNLRHEIPDSRGRTMFGLLQGTVVFVLLIACVNIANLLLARTQARRREIALRAALGAGRLRIVRQLITESLLLAVMGGALGLLLGVIGVRVMGAQLAAVLPSYWAPVIDARVIAVSFGAAALAGLLFGASPAYLSFKMNLADVMKQGGRGSAGTRRFMSRALVVAEIALSIILLAGGSVLVQSFLAIRNQDPGFDADKLLTVTVSLPDGVPVERLALTERMLERARGVPGVTAAAAASALPQNIFVTSTGFTIDGQPLEPDETGPRASLVIASHEYLETLDFGLRSGRFFERGDRMDTAAVVLVSQSVAERHWADDDPIGRRVTVNGVSREIIGIAAEVRQSLIGNPGNQSPGTLYLPLAQQPITSPFLFIRSEVEPNSLIGALRNELTIVDSRLAIGQMQTMTEFVEQFFVGINLFNTILTGFGVLALLLATLGTYGVIAYNVAQRSQEIGVRMALGADPKSILKMVTRQGTLLGIIGLAVGTPGVLAIARVLQSILTYAPPLQPLTIIVFFGVLFVATLAASLVPAARAARLDPVVVLRD